jgi:serine/threonine protein kinase
MDLVVKPTSLSVKTITCSHIVSYVTCIACINILKDENIMLSPNGEHSLAIGRWPNKNFLKKVGDLSDSPTSLDEEIIIGLPDDPRNVLPIEEYNVLIVTRSDFSIDRALGEGSFSKVFMIRVAAKDCNSAFWNDDAMMEGDSFYALKCLKKENVSKQDMEAGAKDLESEAKLLCQLHHTNIIELRGVSSSKFNAASDDCFLVLDLLEETLCDRLQRWRNQKAKIGESKLSVLQRIQSVVLGVATAMAYLHSKHIVHRDLKPDNIGFDAYGDVKVFDFGLACPVGQQSHSNVVGSLRYMAPEAMLARSPGLPADVYSFGIVLWEVVTLKKPYAQIATKADSARAKLLEKVAEGGRRPSTWGVPRKAIRRLIVDCWDQNQHARPSFVRIKLVLFDIYNPEDELDASSLHSSSAARRSHSFEQLGAVQRIDMTGVVQKGN